MVIARTKQRGINAAAWLLACTACAGVTQGQVVPPASYSVSVTAELTGVGSSSAQGVVPQRVYGDWSGIWDPDDDRHEYSMQGSAETFGGLRPLAAVQAEVSFTDNVFQYSIVSNAFVEYFVVVRPRGNPPPGNYWVPVLVNVRGEAQGFASSLVRINFQQVSVSTHADHETASFDRNLRVSFNPSQPESNIAQVRLIAQAKGYSAHPLYAQSSQAYADPLFTFDQAQFDLDRGANTFPLADYFEFEYSEYLLNPPGPPEITTHPVAQTLCEGDGTTFVAAASSDAPMTYQWQLNGGALSDGDGISGAATPELTIDPAQWYHSGTIDCVVSNPAGSVTTNSAALTVGTPATITFPPQAVTAAAGQPVTMTVYTSGSEPLLYQWRRNGENLVDGGRVSGATTSNLTIDPALATDSGMIDVVVSNGCGNATSEAAELVVIGCPADFNGDGFADGFDYDDFVACFEGVACPPGTSADFNDDGFADAFDYDDYVAAFESGC